MKLLGVDLGTSGVKVVVFDPEVGLDASVSCTEEYPLYTPAPGWSEQDPHEWWSAVAIAIRRVLEASNTSASEVAALALSGQMHGATLLDADGQVLRPCILWNDQRSAPQCSAIVAQVGLDNLLTWVGNPALAGFTAPKLLWVREHEPEVYRSINRVLLPKDYINYRLTGCAVTEASDASGTLLFDVSNRRWSNEMVSALSLHASMLPDVYESTDIIGYVTPGAALQTSLMEGTPVVAGGADNACAALSMGVVDPGQVLVSIGTSGTVVAPSSEPRDNPGGRLHSFCHAIPGMWYLMGVVLSAGGSLRWFKDTIARVEAVRAKESGRDPYDLIMEAAAEIPPGSSNLLFLPYLAGERTPHGDADARGVFFGLSLAHTRAHMARSVVEGITFALADSAELIRSTGISVDSIRVTGGGARSPLWRQIMTDIIRAGVVTSPINAGPAVGSAILAGVGVGMFPSVGDALASLLTFGPATEINPDSALLYDRMHELYDSLYPALVDRFQALARDGV